MSRSGLTALMTALAAVAVLAALGIGLLVLVDTDGSGRVTDGPRPPATDGPAPPRPADGAAPPAAPTGDVTRDFYDFAMINQKFAPEWLVRTKRVYWTADGALWANATMPRNTPERLRTIEQICGKLSEYVTGVARRAWRGVSVRAEDGTELLTRANPQDPCRSAP
jgi:hypothetical protein